MQINIYNLLREESHQGAMARRAAFAAGSAAVLGGLLASKGVSVLTAGVAGFAGVAMATMGWVAIVGIVVGVAALVFSAIQAQKEAKLVQQEVRMILNDDNDSSLVQRLADLALSQERLADSIFEKLPFNDQSIVWFFCAVANSDESKDFDGIKADLKGVEDLFSQSMEKILTKALELLPEEAPSEIRQYLSGRLKDFQKLDL